LASSGLENKEKKLLKVLRKFQVNGILKDNSIITKGFKNELLIDN
jgi:hypothetical protein